MKKILFGLVTTVALIGLTTSAMAEVAPDGKCGDGKCASGKCGQGKCASGKCGQGKCASGKCGGK